MSSHILKKAGGDSKPSWVRPMMSGPLFKEAHPRVKTEVHRMTTPLGTGSNRNQTG